MAPFLLVLSLFLFWPGIQREGEDTTPIRVRLHSKEGRSERQKEPWILKRWQPLPAAVSSDEEEKLVKPQQTLCSMRSSISK